ncbi:MAG TPA: DUF2182 domain-containing protein [Longimicrobium sp.]|nr:DUF2182 domain-containing protein [Longimicrobium sp.]
MRTLAPLLAIGAAAWLALLVRPAGPVHASMHSMRPAPAALVADAVLMFAAMMAPFAGAPVRHVRDRSFARRRGRATALFVAGYALPWIAATVALLLVGRAVAAAESPTVLALVLAAVALFQSSPLKQRSLNRCHGHPPLAAFGFRAELDALRFGFTHAAWCIGSCAALMLLPMLFTRGHLAVMAGVTLWLAGERLEKPAPPRWRWRGPNQVARVALGQWRAWRGRWDGGVFVPRATTSRAGS